MSLFLLAKRTQNVRGGLYLFFIAVLLFFMLCFINLFSLRIAKYEDVYETVTDEDGSFIKIVDVGRQIILNRIGGYLPSRTVYFILNLHNFPRRIWLCRHGESMFNTEGKIGGDSGLSDRGSEFASRVSTLQV